MSFQVINLIAGPGVGKSTTAAGLFHRMKLLGLRVELNCEYAKDLVWEDRNNVLTDQLYILAKQHRKLERLKGKVDWVVTDAPLLANAFYATPDYFPAFTPLVWEMWNSYRNHLFHLTRAFGYQREGRYQNEAGALEVDRVIERFLAENKTPHVRLSADGAVAAILRHVGLAAAS